MIPGTTGRGCRGSLLFHRAAAFRLNDQVYIRYHQAKDPNDIGRFFRRRLALGAGWLDDLGERPQESEPEALFPFHEGSVQARRGAR